jgi:hypothetical protein
MNIVERIFEILAENEQVNGCDNRYCEIEWDKENMRKELNDLLENLRIGIIRAVDNIFTKENVITVRLKPEVVGDEVVEIAEEINDFLEKTKRDKILEILC